MGETFEKLAGAVDGADAAPTPDARAGYAAAMPMLEQSLAAWANVRTTELAALDVRLTPDDLARLDAAGAAAGARYADMSSVNR